MCSVVAGNSLSEVLMAAKTTDASIARLMMFAKRIIAQDAARDLYVNHFEEWLARNENALACCEVIVVASFVQTVIATGAADESGISAVPSVRDALASRPAHRSIAITLAEAIIDCDGSPLGVGYGGLPNGRKSPYGECSRKSTRTFVSHDKPRVGKWVGSY